MAHIHGWQLLTIRYSSTRVVNQSVCTWPPAALDSHSKMIWYREGNIAKVRAARGKKKKLLRQLSDSLETDILSVIFYQSKMLQRPTRFKVVKIQTSPLDGESDLFTGVYRRACGLRDVANSRKCVLLQ